MISDSDAIRLAAAVTEATGQEFSDPGAVLFARSLDARMSLSDALRALSEWNRRPHAYYRVQPGELTEIWRAARPTSSLSENRIAELLDPLGLSEDEFWLARRRLIGLVGRGVPEEDAVAPAVEGARGHQLTSRPSKPKKQINHHFAGRIQLSDVIGREKP